MKKDQHFSSDDVSQVMTNMQTVLETVLLEFHQSKEDHMTFKQDVNSQLQEISAKQQNFAELLTNISKALSSEVGKLFTQFDNQKSPSAEETVSVCARSLNSEVQFGISNLQRNISNRFDTLNSSLQTMETTCTDIKRDTDTRATVHRIQYDEIQTLSQRIFETVSDVRNENKKTREHVTEMERSINALSEAGEFQLARTQSKREEQDHPRTIKSTDVPQ